MYKVIHPLYIAKYGEELTEKQAKDLFGKNLEKLLKKSYIVKANANNSTTNRNKSNKDTTKPE